MVKTVPKMKKKLHFPEMSNKALLVIYMIMLVILFLIYKNYI